MVSRKSGARSTTEYDARQRRREQNRIAQRNFRKRRQEMQSLEEESRSEEPQTESQEAARSENVLGNRNQEPPSFSELLNFEDLLPSPPVSDPCQTWNIDTFGDNAGAESFEQSASASKLLRGNEQMLVDSSQSHEDIIAGPSNQPHGEDDVPQSFDHSRYVDIQHPTESEIQAAGVWSVGAHVPATNPPIRHQRTLGGITELRYRKSFSSTRQGNTVQNPNDRTCTTQRIGDQETSVVNSSYNQNSTLNEQRARRGIRRTGSGNFRSIVQAQAPQDHGEHQLPIAVLPKRYQRPNSGGKTALHLSVEKGYVKIVLNILQHGADVNSVDAEGMTALHHAAINGRHELITILLDAGADINALTVEGWTALHMAAEYGYADVASILLDEGADIEAIVGDSHSGEDSA